MTRKKRIIKWAVIVVISMLAVQILFDPLSSLLAVGERMQARLYLPAAREKWEAQDIRHYRFDIQGYFPLVCMFGGGIAVKDGVVIPGPRSDAGDPGTFLSPGLSSLEEPALCDYRNYTVPLLFDEIERWLQDSPTSITQIDFDPQYGFIASFKFGNPGGQGLLSPIIFDCCGGFTIENFQVLDE